LIERLDEPAAICDLHGATRASNQAWRQAIGEERGPPDAGDGLFSVFLRARREGRARGTLRRGQTAYTISVASFSDDRFLLRLQDSAAEATAPPTPGTLPLEARPMAAAFAHPSPFGAALIEGPDPFTGLILEVNAALTAICGQSVSPGATLGDLITAPASVEAAAAHAAGRPGPFEVRPSAAPERTAHLYLVPAEARWVAYLLDVTDQKTLQLQLAQRNKMEAIGQLAGGVAHDFNNLLTAIRLRVDELLLRHTLGDPSYDNLSEIRETVLRAADVVRQLLTFSRKATIQREALDLGETLTNFEVLLHRLLRENVTLTTDYGRDLPLVRADKAQLENAVMNLVVNARDAVHANGGGVIHLRTARLSGEEAVGLGYVGPDIGEMALIEVADDGLGIAPEVIGNIFEPFFTTKPLGEGTGLGLATVYGIVKQSDGWIVARSTLGQGAAFRIFLPAHTPGLSVEAPPQPAQARRATRDLSGVGRILLVEDEALVRGIAARLLRTRGYEVIEASDGEEALALTQQYEGRIDLMISDVIMPGMDGPTLLKAARPFLGAAPVMFISGYAEAEFSDLLEGESGVSFLAKPLDITTLADCVKQRLRGE
jgi:two-component system cell cycle sensor histidine kinase/response regulator CckA